MSAPSLAIETTALRKQYGGISAVDGLDMVVPAGTICALMGRNGAGKSTTLKMLLGLVSPDGGTGKVFGLSIDDPSDSIRIRQRTAFVTEEKSLYSYLTVRQTINFTRSFYPKWRTDLEAKFLRDFELRENATPSQLSKGTRTKVLLLLALCRGADLLILDEPTEGLDPVVIEEIFQALISQTASDGLTVLFSTHRIFEAEQIADSVRIMDHGRMLLEGDLDDLKENFKQIDVTFADSVPTLDLGANQIRKRSISGRQLSLIISGGEEELLAQLRQCNPVSVRSTGLTLKEIFLALTTGQTNP